MEQRKALQIVEGGRSVAKAAEAMSASQGLREATTGQVIAILPRVCAVGAPSAEKMGPQAGVPEQRVEATDEINGRKAGLAERARTNVREAQPAAEFRFYRKYTEALLRRYVQMSMEAGRVSSVMGREVLGGRASRYRVHGFDDAVIFRLDVEKCLRELGGGEREILRRVAMQEYTQGEAAMLLGISLRTCVTRYGRALDTLTQILLRRRLLEPLRGCQVI